MFKCLGCVCIVSTFIKHPGMQVCPHYPQASTSVMKIYIQYTILIHLNKKTKTKTKITIISRQSGSFPFNIDSFFVLVRKLFFINLITHRVTMTFNAQIKSGSIPFVYKYSNIQL